MNIPLLRRIQQHIREEPTRLNMGEGILRAERARCSHSHNHTPPHPTPPCGTVGCIAGWAVLLNLPKPLFEHARVLFDTNYAGDTVLWISMVGRAEDLLELDHVTAEKLFHVEGWSHHAYALSRFQPGTRAYADCVCDYIDWFIEEINEHPTTTPGPESDPSGALTDEHVRGLGKRRIH